MVRKGLYTFFGVALIFWIPFLTYLFPVGSDPLSFLIVEIIIILVVIVLFFFKKFRFKIIPYSITFIALFLCSTVFYLIINRKYLDIYSNLIKLAFTVPFNHDYSQDNLNENGIRSICASKRYSEKIGNATFVILRKNDSKSFESVSIVDGNIISNEIADSSILTIKKTAEEVFVNIIVRDSVNLNIILKNKIIINHKYKSEEYYFHDLLILENEADVSVHYIDHEYTRNMCLLYKFVYWITPTGASL